MTLSKKLLDLKLDLEKATEISNKIFQQDLHLATFFHLSNDLLSISTQEGYFKIVNKIWNEVLGYSCKELTSQKWIEFVHPDDVEKTLEALALLNTETLYNFINRYLAKDGTYKKLSWNAKQSSDGIIYACARVI